LTEPTVVSSWVVTSAAEKASISRRLNKLRRRQTLRGRYKGQLHALAQLTSVRIRRAPSHTQHVLGVRLHLGHRITKVEHGSRDGAVVGWPAAA
jgi:hypothetical protein